MKVCYPLRMKTFLAEHVVGGKIVCSSFEETSMRKAENFARKNGLKLVGELVEEIECPDDVFAMIEKHIYKPSIH